MSLDTRNPRRLPAHRRRELGRALADLGLQLLLDRRYCLVQSTLAIPNEAGASFRADNNTALQANATLQAGASAPGTTYADQYWWDTTNNVLKKRNQANSAWILASTFGTRDEAFVVSRSSNTILGLSDVGKTFVATSTFTQTLTAAATLGDGWYCFYRNDGSGVITIDPNASETIDGGTTLTLNPGDSCRIACNGIGFFTTAMPRIGTWTPSLGGSATYGTRVGDYVKVGRLVFIHMEINVTTIGTGSTTNISGLPFTAARASALSVGLYSSLATAVVALYPFVQNGATTIQVNSNTAASANQLSATAVFGNGTQLILSGCYEI